ncbi:MAG: alpha/beta fold hydrolase [Proteobacteria bacterium]|nr:alpha/beta fold hydrolase [Pseudomonadota bacterium]
MGTMLIILSILIASVSVYLLTVALIPGFVVPRQPLQKPRTSSDSHPTGGVGSRIDVSFGVKGTTVRAWLYIPREHFLPAPCVVMGPPLGATRETGMEPFAARFQEAGFVVVLPDYRHFGASDGQPRQLAWIPFQVEDLTSAVAFARGRVEVDSGRVALWGSSLSAGHAIVIAARDPGIRCICAQCPFLDGRAAALEGLKRFGILRGLRMLPHGQRDYVRSWFGLSAHTIPAFGRSNTIALLADSRAWEAIGKLAPPDFVNDICARILIRLDKYRPINHLRKVRCPVLLQMTNDEISLPGHHLDHARKWLGSLLEIVTYPVGHFDVYVGDGFQSSVEHQLAFFHKHLSSDTSDPV